MRSFDSVFPKDTAETPAERSLDASFLMGEYAPTIPDIPFDTDDLVGRCDQLGFAAPDPLLELLDGGMNSAGSVDAIEIAFAIIASLGGAAVVDRSTLIAGNDRRHLFFDGLQAGCLVAAGALLRGVPELQDPLPFEVRVKIDSFLNNYSDMLGRLRALTRFANGVVTQPAQYFWLDDALDQPSRDDALDRDGRAFTAWAVHHKAWDKYAPDEAVQRFQDTFAGHADSAFQLALADLWDVVPEDLRDYLNLEGVAEANADDWYESIPALTNDGRYSGVYLFASEEKPGCLGN